MLIIQYFFVSQLYWETEEEEYKSGKLVEIDCAG